PTGPAPSVSVVPRQARAGTLPNYTITGGGFAPGEAVTITGGPFTNFAVDADADGGFTTTRQVDDAAARFGRFTITAKGAKASDAFDVYLTRVDVTNSNDVGNDAAIAGSSANLTFRGWGFLGRGGEAVIIRSEPAGLFADLNVTTDSSGQFCCPSLNTNPAAPSR